MKEYQSRHRSGRTVAFFLCAWISVAGLFSCDSDRLNSNQSLGALSLNLSADTSNIKGGAISTKSEFLLEQFENVDNYTVQIFQDADTIKSSLYKDFPGEIEIQEGSYTLRASKGNNLPAAFDNPYFEGSTDFMIKKDMKTPVEVTCRMANARVMVSYTNAFEQAYTEGTVSVRTSLMDEVFTIAKGETRPLYLQVDKEGTPLKIAITLMRSTWKEPKVYEVTNPAITLNPRESVTLKFDTDGKTGDGLSLSIVLDEKMEEADLEFGIPDFMYKPFDAMSIWGCGFENNEVKEMTVTGGYPSDSCTVKANVPGRIKECWVVRLENGEKVDSVDMATSDGLAMAKSWGITPKTSPIYNVKGFELDFKPAFNQLVAGKEDKAVGFSVYANDNLNVMHTSETVTALVNLKAAQEPMVKSFELSVASKHALAKDTSIYVFAEAGIKALSLTEKKDGTLISSYNVLEDNLPSGISYNAKLKKIKFEKTYTQTLESKEKEPSVYSYELMITDHLDVKKTEVSIINMTPVYTILVPDGEIWAKRASFYIEGNPNYTIKYEVLKNGVWEQVSGNTATGLTPGAKNKVRAYVNEWPTEVTEFMTENTLQVPNAGMEEWYSFQNFGNTIYGPHWEVWNPWKEGGTPVWNTLNKKTTSEGGNSIGDAYRYIANSGTLRTDDKHDGSSAALIRTVGWGKGTTAPGTLGFVSWDGEIKRIDPGYLYLGSYTEAPESSWNGVSFDSRPDAVSFYCKYIRAKGKSQSSDKYFVKVVVEYRDGNNVIKLGEGSLSEGGNNDISSYTNKKLKISYINTVLKATHLYIMFKSGTVAEYKYFSVPSKNNLSNGEYVGSKLYIDDVELIYE